MTPISQLEEQLVQLPPEDRIRLIQVLAQSLNGVMNPAPQMESKSVTASDLLDFFRRSPLAEAIADGEELALSRDQSLPNDRFVL